MQQQPETRRGGERTMVRVPSRRRFLLRFLLPSALCLLPAACRTNPRYDLIEAELRTRTRELEEARAELAASRGLNRAYQQGLAARACDAPPGAGPAPGLPVKEVSLGSGTGGADADGRPGDEGLQVVLVPKDDDGSAVKVPGELVVLAFEITSAGTKVPIGRWDVAAETLRRTWRGGLFATGYYVPLRWDRPPTTGKVRVVARLTTLDGRVYEADKDVTVRPLVAAPLGDLPPPVVEPSPVVPPNVVPRVFDELPPPTATETRRPSVRAAPARPIDP